MYLFLYNIKRSLITSSQPSMRESKQSTIKDVYLFLYMKESESKKCTEELKHAGGNGSNMWYRMIEIDS